MELNALYQILYSLTDIINIKLVFFILLLFALFKIYYLIHLLQKEINLIKQTKLEGKNQSVSQKITPEFQLDQKKKKELPKIENTNEPEFKNKVEALQKVQELEKQVENQRKQQELNIQNLQNQINQLQNPIDQQQIAEQDQKIQNLQNQIDQFQNLINQQSQDFQNTLSNQNNIIAQLSQKLQEQQQTIEDSNQKISILSNTQVKFEEQFQLQNKKIEDTFKQVTSIKHEQQQISEQIQNSQKQNDLRFDQLNQEIIELRNLINEKLKQNTIVQDLYDLTIKQRHVEAQYKPFVNDQMTQDDLVLEYGMGNMKCKKTLKQDLRGMRRVRGDGNCFYTSFVFQYLENLLIKENDQEFDNFIKIAKSLKFQIRYKYKEFQENQLKEVQTQFIKQCQEIRQKDQDTRLETLCQLFKDDECEFYGQSIIFLRSLVFQICDNQQQRELFQAQGLNLEQQVLEWEYDCESNEPIINELSNFLKIQTILYFCDQNNKSILVNKFNEEIENPKYTIYLLFRPGHYSIGLPIIK